MGGDYGIGPAGAARILVDVGGVARFAGRNRFASWTGTAPLDAFPDPHGSRYTQTASTFGSQSRGDSWASPSSSARSRPRR
ncbi:transposase [Nocardioides sp. OK12]|uniref:transposase n=1 Tax=Nocardioides sp. OK12 TaxID=2758661 RepID=UPI0034D64169